MFFKKRNAVPPEEAPPAAPESPLDQLRRRVQDAALPPHAQEAAQRELEKLDKTDPAVAEYGVGFNYIELLLGLPWTSSTPAGLDIERARLVLDSRHSGLEQIKQRILEHLAAKTLCQKLQQTILIVDDEAIARSNMEHVLTKDGYRCHCAANGLEALEVLSREEVDLVITDLKMERMDGLELLNHIARLSPEIQVIMVTGFATVSTAVEALRKGAAHYLGKPVNLEELRRTVAEVLEQKRSIMVGKGPVLCFTGPPGTGKTSVGRAIADALHRRFIRISLAGLRDEAELRGHRRTYVGALPGKIINEIKKAGVNNPLFMLDEIDKIGKDFRGDLASVFLEVLDPEQNLRFTDHYLDIPFDLSRVMFIATANDLSQLPGPLLDRMECLEFTGYSEEEKLHIAETFIVPRQLKAAGLSREKVSFAPEAILRVITDYTRESGLRNLERELADICRKLALLTLNSASDDAPATTLDADTVTRLLGAKKYHREVAGGEAQIGIATGLVWAETGGEILSVETVAMPGHGQLQLTGSLGDVLQESARAVLSFIRSRTGQFAIRDDFFETTDLHVHFPSGGIPKDGPSAGITIFVALLSLLTGRPAFRDVALTGEMTLSGRILPVSGIREKLLAARRAGVRRVVLPAGNTDTVAAIGPEIGQAMEISFVAHACEVVDLALAEKSYLIR